MIASEVTQQQCSVSIASDTELLWIQQVSIILIGGGATALAIFVRTVWGLFVLAADIVYVIVLPQLTSALFLRHANAHGALTAFLVGAVLRVGTGEPTVGLSAVIRYPYYDEEDGTQVFPIRGIAFLVSMLCLAGVSWLVDLCFRKGVLPACCDVLGPGRGEGGCSEVYVVNQRGTLGSGARGSSSTAANATSAAQQLGRKLTSDRIRQGVVSSL